MILYHLNISLIRHKSIDWPFHCVVFYASVHEYFDTFHTHIICVHFIHFATPHFDLKKINSSRHKKNAQNVAYSSVNFKANCSWSVHIRRTIIFKIIFNFLRFIVQSTAKMKEIKWIFAWFHAKFLGSNRLVCVRATLCECLYSCVYVWQSSLGNMANLRISTKYPFYMQNYLQRLSNAFNRVSVLEWQIEASIQQM